MLFEVSVIILGYNRPKGLLKAIESVFNQTYMNYEVLVIDNGSTEKAWDLISETTWNKSNLQYIYFDKNETVGKRLNQGISLSRGKYITFLTDDAFWCPEALEVLVDAMKTEADLISGKVKTLDYYSREYIPNTYGEFEWPRGEVKIDNPIHLSSVIVSRNLVDDIGGFNESLRKSYDLDFWNRVYKEHKYVTGRSDECISHLEVNHPKSLSKFFDQDFVESTLGIPNNLFRKIYKRLSFSIAETTQDTLDNLNNFKYNLIALSSNTEANYSIESIDLSKPPEDFNFKSKHELRLTTFHSIEFDFLRKLILFLHSLPLDNNFKKESHDHTMSQIRGGNYLRLNPDMTLSHYFRSTASAIHGVEVCIDPQENHSGILTFEMQCIDQNGVNQKRSLKLQNHEVSRGWNSFVFEPLFNVNDCDILFSFKSDVDFFHFEYAQLLGSYGVMLINKKPIRSSLKYRLF